MHAHTHTHMYACTEGNISWIFQIHDMKIYGKLPFLDISSENLIKSFDLYIDVILSDIIYLYLSPKFTKKKNFQVISNHTWYH